MGYATNIGRLGALAVALGVGYGVADMPTAFADTNDSADSSSSARSHSRSSSAGGRDGSSGAAQRRGTSPGSRPTGASGPRSAASLKPSRVSDNDAPVSAAATTPQQSASAPVESAPASAAVPASSVAPAAAAESIEVPVPQAAPAPAAAAPATTVAPAAATTVVPTRDSSAPAAPRPAATAGSLVAAALAPLVGNGTGGAPGQAPLLFSVLAWARKEFERITGITPPSAVVANTLVQSPNLLVNPGAELGDPALSGNSAVTVPGWAVTGTPTVIKYGTPRNFWPVGLSFPMPDLPSFMSFPKANSGPPDGGVQFFGGGNVASSTLTQLVDLSGAAAEIDTGAVTYDLSGWLGGWLGNPSSASIKVDFLDANKTYLGTTSIGPVGLLERCFQTTLKEREISGSVPEETRYAQVQIVLTQSSFLPLGPNIDYNSAFVDNVSFTVSSDLPAPPAPTPPVSTVGELNHVFMVYMENKGYSDMIGSPYAPFLNSLVNGYGLAQDYYGLTHPSLPNYYWVVNGIDTGITYECEKVCIFDHGTLLTDNIDAAGLTWRGYAQSQPPGQPLQNSGDYSVSELPFVAFEGIGNDEAYAVQHLFPLEQMATDLASSATAPNYAWYAANESFNGEGPIDSIADVLKFAISQVSPRHWYNQQALDQFLTETVTVVLNSTVWQDPTEKSVLVVTFDEDNDNLSLGFGDEGNHIVTVVIPSPGAVAAGMRSGNFIATDHYNHYSLLRMIKDSLGLPTLTNNDKYATPMNEFWT